MSGVVVKRIPYKNRLAKLIQAPGGKRVGEAIADAQARVAELEERSVAEMDRLVLAVHAAGQKTDEASLEAVYAGSNEIGAIAGLFNLADLGQAAFSLCDLLDQSAGAPDPEALKVHLDSLLLLRRSAGLPPEAREEVLKGLKRVVARVAPPVAPTE